MAINSVTIDGYARLRRSGSFPDGTPFVNFSLGHSAYKGKDEDGKSINETQYFECEMIGGYAATLAQDLSEEESYPVVVQGTIKQDRWETNEGDKRSQVKIRAYDAKGTSRVGAAASASPAPARSGGSHAPAEEPF